MIGRKLNKLQLISLLLCLGCLGFITGCNLPQARDIAENGIGSTVEVSQVELPASVPVNLTEPAVNAAGTAQSDAPQGVGDLFPLSTANSRLNTPGPCDLAQAGTPLDVTIPDNSRVSPGESFVKTWRLKNVGSCVWSEDYRVVWYSGDDLGLASQQELGGNVDPGQTFDVSVEMIAPVDPGVYASYWMLRNANGDYFGLGPAGSSPFWARMGCITSVTH